MAISSPPLPFLNVPKMLHGVSILPRPQDFEDWPSLPFTMRVLSSLTMMKRLQPGCCGSE